MRMVWRWRYAVFAVVPISILFAVVRVALFSDPVLREWIRAERGAGLFTACLITAAITVAGPLIAYAARWLSSGHGNTRMAQRQTGFE
jgi:hypothetical protein